MKPLLDQESLAFLETMTRDLVEASTLHPGELACRTFREDMPDFVNHLGIDVIRPGGRSCYPALWMRDFVMSLESGLIPSDTARDNYLVLARHQAEKRLQFAAGGIVEPGMMPDHVSLDDEPIFFPGTYYYAEQGVWGTRAAFDDNFYFIEGAWLIPGLPLKELFPKLIRAFEAVPSDREGVLVECTDDNRGVSFGFTDSIVHTGKLLYASLLKGRAARRLAAIAESLGDPAAGKRFAALAERIREAVAAVFLTPRGMLKASTGKSCQTDVWGSAFAVYENLLPEKLHGVIAESLTELLQAGEISHRGQIRHIPKSEGHWDAALSQPERYQNGCYWGTPVGWVAAAVAKHCPEAAAALFDEFIAELRANDFRKGSEFDAPYECVGLDGHIENPVYLTTVACPCAAAMRSL